MGFDFHEAYDELNPADDDYRFYVALAASHGVRRAIDLGCGTGVLARLLAAQGIDVIGVDPDPDMLRVARDGSATAGLPGALEWRHGDSRILDPESADLAIMCGHVAQVFTSEDAWHGVLVDLARALRPGGVLAFESRNPLRRAWTRWTRAETLRTVGTDDGPVEFWHETVGVELPVVTYDTLTNTLDTGAATASRNVLAFRTEAELRGSVERAGLVVDDVLGDWDGSPTGPNAPELIVLARKL